MIFAFRSAWANRSIFSFGVGLSVAPNPEIPVNAIEWKRNEIDLARYPFRELYKPFDVVVECHCIRQTECTQTSDDGVSCDNSSRALQSASSTLNFFVIGIRFVRFSLSRECSERASFTFLPSSAICLILSA